MEPVIAPEAVADLPDSVFFILEDSGPMTRVTYAGDGIHADFEKEDLVGCFALNEDLATAADGVKQNACYRVSVHTNVDSGKDRRFLAPMTATDDLPKDAAGYMFYYPYDPDIESLDDLKSYAHTVNSDQNDRDRYEASDLLWDICEPTVSGDDRYVEVDMDHAMAQVIVEVESDLIADKTVPTLLNVPLTVSPIDLVKPSLDDMTNEMGEEGSYVLGHETGNVAMWEFGYATSGNLMFRAVIPANHSFDYGDVVIQLTDRSTGEPKKYKITTSIDFNPGKTYHLTLVKERVTHTPGEVGDDDTWVYDVLDPETMEPVGLLCREYVRYQPGVSAGGAEYVTGVGYDRSSGTAVISDTPDTKYVNSQAWVFYGMKSSTVPDLSSGQILQFLYDVRCALPIASYGYQWSGEGNKEIKSDIYVSHCWPEPHVNTYGTSKNGDGHYDSTGGLFTPLHGHQWVTAYNENGIICGQSYQPGLTLLNGTYDGTIHENSLYTEHDMHGGIIKWGKEGNNSHYSITDYSLPSSEVKKTRPVITNQIAHDYGHIAVTDEGAYVSYEDPVAVDHKIGLLAPRYLVDRRVGKNRTVEERLYPIVKIGYNQFWMSQSLRAATLNDGTSIVNFNSSESGKSLFDYSSDNDTPGFMYYSDKDIDYNPYYQMSQEERETLKLSVLYNVASVMSGKMLPLIIANQPYYCYYANSLAITNLANYLGTYPFAKIMTRRAASRENGMVVMGSLDSYKQEAYSSDQLGWFMANICGFDLRVGGAFYSYGFSAISTNATIWCVDDDMAPKEFKLAHWDVFRQKFPSVGEVINGTTGNGSFFPIRFFMKFDGQEDSEVDKNSISSITKGLSTKAMAPVENRDVYAGLEEVTD